jgi:hypothetical protein
MKFVEHGGGRAAKLREACDLSLLSRPCPVDLAWSPLLKCECILGRSWPLNRGVSDYTLIYHGNRIHRVFASTFVPKYPELPTHTRIS